MDGEKNLEKRRVIRRRKPTDGSLARAVIARFRMTQRISSELASIQGLCWRYGKREKMADLWETVCMPALRDYVRPYADRAREDRKARKDGGDAGGTANVRETSQRRV